MHTPAILELCLSKSSKTYQGANFIRLQFQKSFAIRSLQTASTIALNCPTIFSSSALCEAQHRLGDVIG